MDKICENVEMIYKDYKRNKSDVFMFSGWFERIARFTFIFKRISRFTFFWS